MFDLEQSIKTWLRSFNKYRAFDHGSLREMELHLRDHIEDLQKEGKTEEEAFEAAIKEFGEVAPVASEEFSNIRRKPTVRSILYTTMLNNYFKTSFRGMIKNPLSSFINVFGLAVAIGVCIVVYAFIHFDFSTDRHHKNENVVYLASFFVDREGTEEQYGLSPRPLAKMMKEDFSGIQKTCRVEDQNVVLKYGDKVFNERIRCVDPEFLEMLTFPLKWGTPNSLEDLNSIILSEKMATKYFGDANPIGQSLLMKFTESRSKTFTVTGVAEAFPRARAIEFDFLINFENFRTSHIAYDFGDWRELVDATLIQVDNAEDLPAIQAGMEKYRELQNEVEKDWAISSFELIKLRDLHFRSGDIRGDISHDNLYVGRVVLPVLAILMLALACFNYINIAIVSAAKRLREIGLRKVIGANRRLVIIQFLSENIFVTFFALLTGFGLAVTLFLPWFVELSGMELELSLQDQTLWIFLTSTLLFTGIASGIYPAFYISKFQVTEIFQGTVRFGQKSRLTKVFLVMQLILACTGITGAVMMSQNSAYQSERSWGYEQRGVLYAQVPDESGYNQLHAVMSQNPDVVSVSGSGHHLGKNHATSIVRTPEREYEVSEVSVGPGYFETMGLELTSGRFFKENHESDKKALIVNELLVENMSLEQPIGHQLKIDSTNYVIAGVVKNFHFNNFYYENLPTIFTLSNKEDYRYLSMRVRKGTEYEFYKSLQSEWSALYPETPFFGGHQEDVWGVFYEELDIQERFMRTVAYIAVLLASLGLYGLVTLNVTGRVREFSIRKVLGAGTKNIASNIFRQYIILSLAAIVFGAPISHFLITANIDLMYPDPRPMGYSGVAIAVVILVLVLVTVISTQIRKVLRSNPVEGLKAE